VERAVFGSPAHVGSPAFAILERRARFCHDGLSVKYLERARRSKNRNGIGQRVYACMQVKIKRAFLRSSTPTKLESAHSISWLQLSRVINVFDGK